MRTFTLITIFAALWWLLSNGSVNSWLLGLPVVIAAAWFSLRFMTQSRTSISFRGLVRFMLFFIHQSFRGGVDVARRTLSPKLDVQPHFHLYHTTCQSPIAKTLLCYCISLLPGTLSVQLTQAGEIEIHALSTDMEIDKELAMLEHKLSALFKQEGIGHA